MVDLADGEPDPPEPPQVEAPSGPCIWNTAAQVTDGPLLREVNRSGRVGIKRLRPAASAGCSPMPALVPG